MLSILSRNINNKFNQSRKYCRSLTSDQGSVITEKINKVLTIGINRPKKKNCVNHETAERLFEAFSNFEADDSLHVAVLHGVGGTFCSGYDLSEITGENLQKFGQRSVKFSPMGPTHMPTKKPIIAAMDGFIVAGGLELALMCDLRVVDETASIGVYNRRFGVPLIDGGTVRLPKLIGLSRALDLILTGRPISAKEALEFGLANRVVACGTALGNAVDIAENISKFPQECLRCDRSSAYNSTYDSNSLQDALKYETENAKQVLHTEAVKGAELFMKGFGKSGKFFDAKDSV
ncbi:Uncharacterised protein g4313 [Pycnogonum litorale]